MNLVEISRNSTASVTPRITTVRDEQESGGPDVPRQMRAAGEQVVNSHGVRILSRLKPTSFREVWGAVPVNLLRKEFGTPLLTRVLFNLESEFAVTRRDILGQDYPSETALAAARRFIEDADKHRAFVLEPSSIESFEGDILIYWNTLNRGICLVCPANGTPPKLYREVVENRRAKETELIENVTPRDLTRLIRWILS
jgi:hypothetical protein